MKTYKATVATSNKFNNLVFIKSASSMKAFETVLKNQGFTVKSITIA